MLLSLVACSGGGDNQAASQGSSTTAVSTGSSTAPETAKIDPLGKYDPAITIRSVFDIGSTNVAPKEMSPTNNPWVKAWKEELGINMEYMFISNGDYETKLNLLITSGDIPDIFGVKASLFNQLVEDGKLADLTDVYEKYASDRTKELFNQDSGLMAKNTFIDGKRYGMVQPADYADNICMIAIRNDWLKKVNMEAPKNMDDLWKIAQAFKDAKLGGDKTIGVSAIGNLFQNTSPIRELFNGYRAYQGIWLEKNGKLEYSSIQPEMRNALGKLAEQYKKGLIDPEFGTKNMDKMCEDILANRSGIMLNDFTAPFRTINGIKAGQDWGYYPMVSEDGGIVKSQQSAAFSSCVVVSKNCKNPEAIMKLFNLTPVKADEDFSSYCDKGIGNYAYPFTLVANAKNVEIYRKYKQFIETGTMPDGDGDFKASVQSCESYRKDKNMDGYVLWSIFSPEGTEKWIDQAQKNDGYIVNAYTGAPTDTMNTTQSVLDTMESEAMIQIIMGKKPVDYFDEFVANWEKAGGDTITAEVNKWYQATNK
jgi:ABC-type sugar transport system, periplasmic component